MTKYHSPKEYLDAAKSTDTPVTELRALASARYSFVLTAVAGNPNTDSELLATLVPDKISSWNEQELALEIARHPNTSTNTIHVLACRIAPMLDNGRGHQIGFKAGVLICASPRTPLDVVEALLKHEKAAMQFRKVVAREARRQDVLEILAVDRSETVRRHALRSLDAISSARANGAHS